MRRGENLAAIRYLVIEANTKHGESRPPTSEYQAWKHMMSRCNNLNDAKYSRYGRRGIEVCERWYDYQSFLEDMGRRPKGTTLGRIDNDGDYEPKNCEWQTHKVQARNTRRNRLILFQGKRRPLIEVAEMIGLKRSTLEQRLKRGWSLRRATTTPLREW